MPSTIRRRGVVPTAVLTATLLGAAPTTPLDELHGPVDALIDTVAACDDLDDRLCLLPFPNDGFTSLDPSTRTGRRVDLDLLAMPRSVAGKPIDPTEWNRNDGFSPGAMLLTHVPGLDLTETYDLDPDPETGPASGNGDPFVLRDEVPDTLIEDPARTLGVDSPIVLLDADTGRRHPFWAELDEHPETMEGGGDRLLVIRPLVNLAEGHRYIVALRDLEDGAGSPLAAAPAFAGLRNRLAGDVPAVDGPGDSCVLHPGQPKLPPHCPPFPAPADIDPADRDRRYLDIFTRLARVGVDVEHLYLAWDFHVASADNLAGRALAIRDDAFRQLGDPALHDLTVEGRSPHVVVDEVVDGDSGGHPTRTVHGRVTVPNYLTWPQDSIGADLLATADLPGVVPPNSRFLYPTPTPGPMDTPIQNPLVPTLDAEFTCKFRTDLPSVRPTLYGHGLLGGRGEVEGGSTEDLRRGGHATCATDWIGMATEDLPNVLLILHDVTLFSSLADRSQQGFLNFLYLGRALVHEAGLAATDAFRVDGRPILDTSELYFNGNSQGGIMGGALTALAPDLTKSVLGVPGMNYSTLLNRSVDWEGEYLDPLNPGIPAYGSFLYTAYPDKVEQQLIFALIQMLWDRAEANGYAHHMTDDPLPNTPAHQVLLEVALGDYQVTNHAAEVEARTIGADFLGSALAPGRHWEPAYTFGDAATPFGFDDFVLGDDGVAHAASGSAIVYWDSGNPVPPNGNVPPADMDHDPHEDPRRDDAALEQKLRFYRDGTIVDVHDGGPYWTANCPRHPDHDPGC